MQKVSNGQPYGRFSGQVVLSELPDCTTHDSHQLIASAHSAADQMPVSS